ncbi:NYN domain-containing protein [Nitrospira sp. Nam74]
MSTHLIIDGYNVLGKRGQVGPNSEMAREHFVQELMMYRQRKGHAITVVFDGWKQGLRSEHREHRSGVEVIYSKRGEQADQVIGRLAAEYGRSCAVVSSDHEIQGVAKAHEAFVLSASEFESRLRERAISTQRTAYRGKDAEEDGPSKRDPAKKGNARKLPKKLRRRNQQLRGF